MEESGIENFRESMLHTATLDCVHCGLCLSTCPTYRATGRESSSPRGRVYMMRGAAEGRIDFGESLVRELDLCLGCRACETACPSGIKFGAMLEEARAVAVRSGLRGRLGYRLERWGLRHLLAWPQRLQRLVSLLGFVQRLGLDRLLGSRLPASLAQARSLLPPIPPAHQRTRLPAFTPAQGERRGRVAFLEGCVMAELFAEVNRASVRILARNGFDVLVPPEQTCCGALHAHAGDLETARRLGESNRFAFIEAVGEPVEAVISNSAGCGAALRGLEDWLPGSGAELAGKVRDVCEWLDEKGLREPPGRLEARVCYDDPCHLVHAQGVMDAPRRLLEEVPGLELIPHAESSSCCGAAGTYNLLQTEMSQRVLAPKLAALEAASPDWIATGNPGCMLQLRAGVEARGLSARVVHPVELLDRAYGSS